MRNDLQGKEEENTVVCINRMFLDVSVLIGSGSYRVNNIVKFAITVQH